MTYSGCMWKEIYRHSYYFALILLWKVFKNLMHIIHAYYEQCVFYRYKVCKLLLNILWLGTLWLLYKYYKKTCSREVRLPPYKEVHKCGPGGERGGGGGGRVEERENSKVSGNWGLHAFRRWNTTPDMSLWFDVHGGVLLLQVLYFCFS